MEDSIYNIRHTPMDDSKISYNPPVAELVTLKTGRREVPDSIPGRACRPNRSEFSVVFSETRVNTG